MKPVIVVCFLLFSNTIFAQQKSLDKYQSVFDNELKEWTKSFKNFNLHSFVCDEVIDFHQTVPIYMNDSAWNDYTDLYKPILSFSPDSSKFVDIYFPRMTLEKRNDSVFNEGGSDSWISLGDLNNKTETYLFFLSLYNMEHTLQQEVTWINNNEFLIAEIYLSDSSNRVFPQVYLGNCKERKLQIFSSSDTACCTEIQRYASPKFNNIKIYDE